MVIYFYYSLFSYPGEKRGSGGVGKQKDKQRDGEVQIDLEKRVWIEGAGNVKEMGTE